MSPVSELGVVGFVLFWGLTALAVGFFARRIYQLLSYLLLGRSGGGFRYLLKRTLTTIGHFVGQKCQFKNLRLVDRAGLGHIFMAWGFFLFVIYP